MFAKNIAIPYTSVLLNCLNYSSWASIGPYEMSGLTICWFFSFREVNGLYTTSLATVESHDPFFEFVAAYLSLFIFPAEVFIMIIELAN